MAQRLLTERLVLRPWTIDDAAAALGAYGDAEVARWLVPSMDRVLDAAAMRLVLQQWVAEDTRLQVPAGRWAIELREGGRLIGGGTPLPPPPGDEVGIRWRVGPGAWGDRHPTAAGPGLSPAARVHGDVQGIPASGAAHSRAIQLC